MKNVLTRVKNLVTSLVARAVDRHLVWLPRQARSTEEIFDATASYRSDGRRIECELRDAIQGRLNICFSVAKAENEKEDLWTGAVDYTEPTKIAFDFTDRTVSFGDRKLGGFSAPGRGRRYQIDLQLDAGRVNKRRRTTHYFPTLEEKHGEEYFRSGNYDDYDAQSQGEIAGVVEWLERSGAKGPLLEVGCATGVVLRGLQDRGWDVYGVDISAWAIEQASKRLPDRVACFNIETDALPSDWPKQYGTLLLWNVLEHFHRPYEILAKLTEVAAPQARLLIATSNADGVGRLMFGRDWEGYFDPTHYGVDIVGVKSLRERLPALGWRIQHLVTDRVWDCSSDPQHATLREWWANDARCRLLLRERELGDLVQLSAVRG